MEITVTTDVIYLFLVIQRLKVGKERGKSTYCEGDWRYNKFENRATKITGLDHGQPSNGLHTHQTSWKKGKWQPLEDMEVTWENIKTCRMPTRRCLTQISWRVIKREFVFASLSLFLQTDRWRVSQRGGGGGNQGVEPDCKHVANMNELGLLYFINIFSSLFLNFFYIRYLYIYIYLYSQQQ